MLKSFVCHCSTFVCPTEIIAFSDRADEFRKINCELIACSTDSHFCHLAWVNTPRKQGGLGSLNIPLLADKSAAISKSYGVYKEDEGLTFRGLFIIDEQQRLRQVTINDLPVGRSVDETLRLVQAFQFTDKHGEGNKKTYPSQKRFFNGFIKQKKNFLVYSLPCWLDSWQEIHEGWSSWKQRIFWSFKLKQIVLSLPDLGYSATIYFIFYLFSAILAYCSI